MHHLLIVSLLSAAAVAQQVWTVPSGASVQNAIAQASPGDVLVLQGTYYSFTVDKGVTILGNGAVIAGPLTAGFAFQVPPGQRASVDNLTISAPGGGSVFVHFGDVALSNVTGARYVTVRGASSRVHMQRMTTQLRVDDGICAVTDCALVGISASTIDSTAGLEQNGGVVLVSQSTMRGGAAGVGGFPPLARPASAAVRQVAGVAFVTDSTMVGGVGTAAAAGGAAIDASGALFVARCSLQDDHLAVAPSNGQQLDATMVGMRCSAPPVRGASFVVTATAGNSLDLLAIVGGFDRTMYVAPPFVEPLVGNPMQWVLLTAVLPAAGAAVPVTVPVPNQAALQGVEVWLQAVQFAGSFVRASTAVGGAIR